MTVTKKSESPAVEKTSQSSWVSRTPRRIFIRHYLEMVLGMLLGMGLLGWARTTAGLAVSIVDRPTLAYLLMALDMSIGMAVVMRWRRHRWRHVAEMSVAMFAPAILFPLLAGVVSLPRLMVIAHVAMFVLMLAIMLLRRDSYSGHPHPTERAEPVHAESRRRRRRRLAGIGKVAAVLLVTILVPVAVAAPAVTNAREYFYTEPPGQLPVTAAPTPYDPDKPTAVVVLGNDGTNAADALPPYEILAASGAFNVYSVAKDRRLVPLVGGLDVVPDLSFAQLEQLLGAPPDVIVVPQIENEPGPGSPIISWLNDQRRVGSPLLVSVCVGAETLAEAGYLDGRPATSHWLGLIGLRRSYPDVMWRDNVRYVDDGDIITSAGVLSGIDGTLRAVERFAGQEVAAKAANSINWTHYSPGQAATLQPSKLAPPDGVALLSAAYRWDRENLGVLLIEGVTETELASAFRGYTELNFLAKPLAYTLNGQPIRSRHGLTFVPRGDATAAVRMDRILVPGEAAAARRDSLLPAAADGVPVSYPQTQPGFAFDGTLIDIAQHYDAATARWVAKSLQYPVDGLNLAGASWPWNLTVRLGLLTALGLILALTAARVVPVLRRSPIRIAALLQHWPALAGLLFALAIGAGAGRANTAAVLAAAMATYVGAAVLGSRRSDWLWFLGTAAVITADRLTQGAINATAALVAASALLLLLGVLRRSRGASTDPALLRAQLPAWVGFGGLALAAIAASPVPGAVLVAGGLLCHSLWDWYHYRSRRVVTRSFALFCLALDATVAVLVLAATFTRA